MRGANRAVVGDVQRGSLVLVEPEGGACIHGQGGDRIAQGLVQRKVRISGDLHLVKVLERSEEAGSVVVEDELLLPVHCSSPLAVDGAGVFVKFVFGTVSGGGGNVLQGDGGASVDGAAGLVAAAQERPCPVVPVSLAQNGVRARDGQAGSLGDGAVRFVPGVDFVHERSAVDVKGGGAGDGFVSRVKAAENAVGEHAVIEHHGDVPVHGGGIGSRHGGAVRLPVGEGGVIGPGGGGEFQVNIPVDGAPVNSAEYRGFANGPFRQAQVDVPVQVARRVASYPAVIAADAFPQRHPQVLAAVRAAIGPVVGVNEFGASRSRDAGNVGVGAVAGIIRGIGPGRSHGGGGGARCPFDHARLEGGGSSAVCQIKGFRSGDAAGGGRVGEGAVQRQIGQDGVQRAGIAEGEAGGAAPRRRLRLPDEDVPQPDIVARVPAVGVVPRHVGHADGIRIGGHVFGVQDGASPLDVRFIDVQRSVAQIQGEVVRGVPAARGAVAQAQGEIHRVALVLPLGGSPVVSEGAAAGFVEVDRVVGDGDVIGGKALGRQRLLGDGGRLAEVDAQFVGGFPFLPGGPPRVPHALGQVARHQQVPLGVRVQPVRRGIVEHGAHPVERGGGGHVNDARIDVNDFDAVGGVFCAPFFQGFVVGGYGLVRFSQVPVGMLRPAGDGHHQNACVAVGGADGGDDGIHVAQQKVGDPVQPQVQRTVVVVGKEVVGAGEQEKRVRRVGPGKGLARVGSPLGFFRAQAQPVLDVGAVKPSVAAAVRPAGDFIGPRAGRGGMEILENPAAVGGSRGHSAAVVAGHDTFFGIADAVVCKNFVHGPVPGAAVDAMGDGVPYVHDVAKVSV